MIMYKPILLSLLLMGLTGCGGEILGSSQSSVPSSSAPSVVSSLGVSSSSPSVSSSTSSLSTHSSSSAGVPLAQWHYVLGINVGGAIYKAPNGLTYEADRYFTGGTAYQVTSTIAGTDQQALYQSERWGAVDYQIPAQTGRYKVVLKFVEMYWGANDSRVLNVQAEGKMLTQGLDIHAQVGKLSAYDFTSDVIEVTDGSLSISVVASKHNSTLAGIEVYADRDNRMSFDSAAIDAGAIIYAKSCAQCHGEDGKGKGLFPSLIVAECKSCGSPAAMISVISRTMPLSGDNCSGDCAHNVSAYILSELNKDQVVETDCRVKDSPIRRLTRFEYSNTVQDLFGDTTRPGNLLPSEEIGNGFGNDARSMSVSSLLAEQYGKAAEGIAQRLIDNPTQWQRLHSCVQNVNTSTQQSCADQIIASLVPKVFRRAVSETELQTFRDLQRSILTKSDFKKSIAGVVEALLQSPEFLYRAERGTLVNGRLQPTGYEMATRLSYFFWGTTPDDQLLQAAAQNRLSTAEEVKVQAERLLADDRSRTMIRFFFDNYLPISGLTGLERDAAEFPTFNASIGAMMREETQAFLEHIIFDGSGDWASAFTAPYSFMNEALAKFYGIGGVSGDFFREVPVNTNQRMGFLTQAGVMAGTTHSTKTNPVARGAYVMKKLLCVDIPLPVGDIAEEIKPPDPSSGPTARDRYSQHSSDGVCKQCHVLMDPVGLVFENYDPVGLFRTHENNVLIDATGGLPGTGIAVDNALQLVSAIAEDPRTHQCFAYNWANYAYGKTIGASESCIKETITEKFSESGNDIQSLLVDLTQTDAFLFLPADHRQ